MCVARVQSKKGESKYAATMQNTEMNDNKQIPADTDIAEAAATDDFNFPVWKACTRKFAPDEPFFEPGNAEREFLAKQAATVGVDEEDTASMHCEDIWNLECPIMGCKAELNSLADFEDHYVAKHSANCSVCAKCFPTARLLDIHISESHDSFFKAKVARGYPMYVCLVESCSSKFNCDEARHQHLVDKHKFPKEFAFHTKKHFSKQQRQRFQGRLAHQQTLEGKFKESTSHCCKMSAEENENTVEPAKDKDNNMEVDQTIDALASAVSKLSTKDSIPTVVCFGRRHNRGFQNIPRAKDKN